MMGGSRNGGLNGPGGGHESSARSEKGQKERREDGRLVRGWLAPRPGGELKLCQLYLDRLVLRPSRPSFEPAIIHVGSASGAA